MTGALVAVQTTFTTALLYYLERTRAHAAQAGVGQPATVSGGPARGRSADDETRQKNGYGDPSFWSVWRLIGLVAGQTTLITALLYYFGWARADAEYSYFGVDADVLRISTADFLLRSITAALRPLILVGLTALAGLIAHAVIMHAMAHDKRRFVLLVLRLTATAGVLLVTAGFLGFENRIVYSTRYPMVPIFLGVGLGLATYAAYLHMKLADARYPPRLLRVAAGIVVSLLLMLMFWTTAVYAGIEGFSLARSFDSYHLKALPRVVLFSREDLAFDDRIVTETVGATPDGYHYKYSRLRLLTESGTRYLLLPEGWVRGRDSAYVIEERPGLRLEFLTEPPATPSATTLLTAAPGTLTSQRQGWRKALVNRRV